MQVGVSKFFNGKKSVENVFLFFSFVFIGVLFADLMYNFISIPATRHDELKYINSYYNKLVGEGRWLNYLFFDSLKNINIKFSSIVCIICFFIFSFQCIKNVLDEKYSFLIASLCILIPPIHLLNEWTQTIFFGFVVLAMSSLCYEKINKLYFFILFGILFNATMNHFYFLLPLLFLKKIDINMIFYWVIGFCLGFLVSEIMTWILSNNFITLESWRKPNYIHGFEDIIINLKKAFQDMFHNYNFFGKTVLYLFPVCGLIISYEIFKKNLSLVHIIVLAMVSASVFALAVPAGLYTYPRSTACLFMATIMFFVLALRKVRIFLVIFAIFLSSYFYTHNMQNITFIKTVMASWMSDLASIPVVPESIRGLVVLSEDKDFNRLSNYIQQNAHVRPHLQKVLEWQCDGDLWRANSDMGLSCMVIGQRILLKSKRW